MVSSIKEAKGRGSVLLLLLEYFLVSESLSILLELASEGILGSTRMVCRAKHVVVTGLSVATTSTVCCLDARLRLMLLNQIRDTLVVRIHPLVKLRKELLHGSLLLRISLASACSGLARHRACLLLRCS